MMNTMKILLIDTASDEGSVSLWENDALIETIAIGTREQAATLLPAIDSVLKNNVIPLETLDRIGVNIGPGSFTGTRVGVMTAKTLAASLPKTDLVGYTIFDGYERDEEAPRVLVDAKRGRCFCLRSGRVHLLEANFLQTCSRCSFISPDPQPILRHHDYLLISLQKPDFARICRIVNSSSPYCSVDECRVLYLTNP